MKHIEYKNELIIIVDGPIIINSINASVKWQDHNQFFIMTFWCQKSVGVAAKISVEIFSQISSMA